VGNVLGVCRVRFIPQMEMAECGAACLAMILAYHGRSVPLALLREACGVSRDGVNALGIVHAAAQYGLDAKGFKVNVAALQDVRLPAIVHWEFKHFVVLERITQRGAVIVDPAGGRRRVSRAEFDGSFTGVMIALSPGEGFVRGGRVSVSFARYVEALRCVWPSMVRALGAALLLNILSIVTPAGTQFLVDHVLKPQREHWLLPLIIALAAAGLTRVVLRLMRDRALLLTHFALDATLFTQFVDRMSRLTPTFFDQRTVGDLMQRVDANRSLRDLTSQLAATVLDGFLLFSFGALMFAYDLKLAALVLSLSLARLLLTLSVRPYLEQAVASELTHRGREQTVLVEAFHSPEIVRAFGMQERLLDRFVDRLTDRLNAQAARTRISSVAGQLTAFFDSASLAALLYVGGQSVLAEEMSLGVLTGFLSLHTFLRTPLEALAGAYQQFEQTRGILHRVDDVLDTPVVASGREDPGQISGAVTFDHVSFRYAPRGPWTLDDVTLQIRPGEKIALVGRSGQGKSTLLRTFLGMIQPEKGAVLIDGRDLRTLNREAFLQQVGVVSQEPFMVDESVHDNIAFRRAHVRDEDVVWAASVACIHEVIERLPQGYQTRLSGNGSRLSGGQRQRLSLARALAGRPRILVLDEATSALDRDNETNIEANLRRIGCTRIVVAHRIDTVRDADRIVVVSEGRLVQVGSYEQLRSAPGLFASLNRAEAAS